MKKLFSLIIAFSSTYIAFSQDSSLLKPTVDTLPITNPQDLIEKTERENRNESKLSVQQLAVATRPKDHLLLQFGVDGWGNMPDSINKKGFSRSFNMYLLFDFPFKTNPHLSVAVGAGFGTSNIYFKDTYIDVAGLKGNTLSFQDVSDTLHFKKYKLLTTYIEAPVEFRYMGRPEQPNKSFKVAIGGKVGLLVGAGTKGKNLQNSVGNTVNSYIQKEKSKRYFNNTRIAVTGRIGYGNFSVFGVYQVNAFVKEGFGPDVRPFSVGLTLSGL